MTKPLIIIGAGGQGGCVHDIAVQAGFQVKGFLDTVHAKGDQVLGLPVLGSDEYLDDAEFVAAHAFAIGIGEPGPRRRYGRRLKTMGADLPNIINPSSFVSPHADLGVGVFLMGFNAVNHQARVSDFAAMDWHATLGHHSVLGECCFVGPGAHVAGRVSCGDETYIGIGACTVEKIRIGSHTVIGAGATVTKDVPDHVLAVGSPAKVIREI